ncbi:MAG: hypothetical protein CHACPFDD_01958 [Phycisphaerae bacterium]|nr:hypothetical protein [Phycisphaerae bacterium]
MSSQNALRTTIAGGAALGLIAAGLALGLLGCGERRDGAGWGDVGNRRGEPAARRGADARMNWWREARFGMFIHWGLYAIPAGEWKGRTDHAEWIRHTAQIPIDEYDKLVGQFNPVKFNADEWVRMARDAGMRYIVITSKHHDGFALFDSKQTDFDVMSTPFKRDILKELADACRKHGVRLCFYHSIMDWHHPDYLPRRPWEAATRSADGADLDRYVAYMKGQLRELLTNYGRIGVLWFDGEWENTWTHARGADLYNYVRGLQPDIIVNNRVDVGRSGMAGMTKDGSFAGDFGTPEQEIPATGFPGVDWESCMTMNANWGYNKGDRNWKSTTDIVRMLADVTSKGGNLLLNVGPRADGTFPPESVERLAQVGRWMSANGESIYGTHASPFKSLPWGRCTQRVLQDLRTLLYLHVFDWPADGRLVVTGIYNKANRAYLLSDKQRTPLPVSHTDDAIVIDLPRQAPDAADSVVVLDIQGDPDVPEPPSISASASIFVESLDVRVACDRSDVELRYTLDGSPPTAESSKVERAIRLTDSATVSARAFRAARPVSAIATSAFRKVPPRATENVAATVSGVSYEYYEGLWQKLPDFNALQPAKTGVIAGFDFSPRQREERFAFRYRTYLRVPTTGVYTFYLTSDDGSRLWIGEDLVVDNDGLHGAVTRSGEAALAAGLHALTIGFFERDGGDALALEFSGPGIDRQRIPPALLQTVSPSAAAASPARRAPSDLPRPTPRQLAWQQMEYHAFVHFGMNTFTNREWGEGKEDPALFNPTEFDARQWAQVFKDAGMKQVVLSCKHHDGFCLWPSKYTDHSVSSSPWRDGRGDVVRELSDACRGAGLKFGVYLSPWDRHEPCYGDSPRYNEHFKNQLRELLTDYGPVHEVWFDGACGEGPNGKKQVYDWPGFVEVVRQYAPDAVIFSDAGPDIRWVGNEAGFAGETNWSTLRRDEFYPGTPNHKPLTDGHEDGGYWVPAECDVSIRPGWFHHPAEDDKVKSLGQLLDIYYGSVGRNGVLLLNVPPDPRGRIHENDAGRLRELRAALDETFQTNFALGHAPAGAADGEHGPRAATDGDPATYWDLSSSADWAIDVDLDAPQEFDRILLQEHTPLGQRVKAFVVEVSDGSGWQAVAHGTTIGYKRLLRIPAVTAARVRVTVRDALASPAISEFGLYRASARERSAS